MSMPPGPPVDPVMIALINGLSKANKESLYQPLSTVMILEFSEVIRPFVQSLIDNASTVETIKEEVAPGACI